MAEVRRLASKNMAEKMSEMEENTAEVIQFTCSKMADMEEKAAEMVRDMSRKNRCMKSEMEKVKAWAYYFPTTLDVDSMSP